MRQAFAWLMLLVFLGGCSGGGGGGNSTASSSVSFPSVTPAPKSSPYAVITFLPKNPAPGDVVAFAVAFTLPNRVAKAYDWDFGDKGNSSLAAPTHAYAAEKAGTGVCKDKGYTVSVEVTDDKNGTTTGQQCVPVKVKPPTVSFTFSPATPAPGDSVVFSGSAHDTDGNVTSYGWEFGDGGSATTAQVTHVFKAVSSSTSLACKGGGFNVTLTVGDDDGGRTMSKQCVIVKVREPVVSFTWFPLAPKVGDAIQFNGTANDADGKVVSLVWDFDDGGTSTVLSPTHTYTAPGTHTAKPCGKTPGFIVQLHATDDDGGVGTVANCVLVTT